MTETVCSLQKNIHYLALPHGVAVRAIHSLGQRLAQNKRAIQGKTCNTTINGSEKKLPHSQAPHFVQVNILSPSLRETGDTHTKRYIVGITATRCLPIKKLLVLQFHPPGIWSKRKKCSPFQQRDLTVEKKNLEHEHVTRLNTLRLRHCKIRTRH